MTTHPLDVLLTEWYPRDTAGIREADKLSDDERARRRDPMRMLREVTRITEDARCAELVELKKLKERTDELVQAGKSSDDLKEHIVQCIINFSAVPHNASVTGAIIEGAAYRGAAAIAEYDPVRARELRDKHIPSDHTGHHIVRMRILTGLCLAEALIFYMTGADEAANKKPRNVVPEVVFASKTLLPIMRLLVVMHRVAAEVDALAGRAGSEYDRLVRELIRAVRAYMMNLADATRGASQQEQHDIVALARYAFEELMPESLRDADAAPVPRPSDDVARRLASRIGSELYTSWLPEWRFVARAGSGSKRPPEAVVAGERPVKQRRRKSMALYSDDDDSDSEVKEEETAFTRAIRTASALAAKLRPT